MTVDYIPPPKSYSNEGPYSLDKMALPQAHIIHGREFPVAYQLNLNGEKYDESKVEQLLADFSKDGTFTRLLENHGTVVLRDTVEDSDTSKAPRLAEKFRVVEENRGLVEFQQNGTRSLREKKGYNLYVANTRVPASKKIHQHNEFSRFKTWPTTIDFTIPEYTAVGGETSLVHGGELFQKLQKELPEFLAKLSKVGLKFNKEIWEKKSDKPNGLVWNHEVTFGRYIKPGDDLATQKAKAEKIAKEYISDKVEWNDQDDIVVTSLTQPVKQFNGEPLVFSSLAAYVGDYYEDFKDDPKIKFGNDDPFDEKDLKKYVQLVVDSEYNHEWKSGDLVFVHNFQVSHGRLPYKDGKRTILVGMWDEKVPERRKLFVNHQL